VHPRLELHLHDWPRWAKPVRVFAKYLRRRGFRCLQGTLEADVFHPTYYELLSQVEWSECRQPLVLTVHDMIHERFQKELDPRGKTVERKRRAIAAATAIICVSERTKADLLEMYPIPEGKITVIPHASDLRSPPAGEPWPVEPPYFLYIGIRAFYKNFTRLLAALRNVVGRHGDVRLYVVGPPFRTQEQAQLTELGLQDHVRHRGYVTDEELARLYRGSVAFVYPSLYEGFGIPLLEAMSCGGVVVASNRSSIPEVVGDAGLLFDPTSTDELTDTLISLLESPAQRLALIDKGYQRVQQFSWQRTAEQTMAVYESVANH
jgi:glycosyltransferase involved in cell wall biosynthesis